MTYADIVFEVMDRLNLSSLNASARVGRSVNERYKWLCDTIGIQTIQRVNGVTAITTINQQTLTFGPTPTGVEKIYSLYNAAYTPPMFLEEVTQDEVRMMPGTDPPQAYAVVSMGASTVTVLLSSVPSTQYTLTADVDPNVTTLVGLAVPNFSENFHNLLVYGAMATELDHMEKYDMATVQENRWAIRLSDYRMYIQMTAWKELYSGQISSEGPPVQLLQ